MLGGSCKFVLRKKRNREGFGLAGRHLMTLFVYRGDVFKRLNFPRLTERMTFKSPEQLKLRHHGDGCRIEQKRTDLQ